MDEVVCSVCEKPITSDAYRFDEALMCVPCGEAELWVRDQMRVERVNYE